MKKRKRPLHSVVERKPSPAAAPAAFGPDEILITEMKVRRALGGKSKMTIHRWRKNPKLKFPKPKDINGRNYYVAREIVAWIDQRQRAA